MVDEFDLLLPPTDNFFDVAVHVQKAGNMLCAHSLWETCFQGGKHVHSLFFIFSIEGGVEIMVFVKY